MAGQGRAGQSLSQTRPLSPLLAHTKTQNSSPFSRVTEILKGEEGKNTHAQEAIQQTGATAGHSYAKEEKPGKGGMKLGLSRQVLQQTAFQSWPEQTSPGCSSHAQPFQRHFTKSTRESAGAAEESSTGVPAPPITACATTTVNCEQPILGSCNN